MSFEVKIDQFDGPLDLMLHLIKEKQLDIFNLDIVVLADQYLDYIHHMQQMKLDIASEYIVELATLIEYKSRKLLPVEPNEIDDNYQQDNEEQLVRRLIEYQKYKEITAEFEKLYTSRNLLHDKPVSDVEITNSQEDSYTNTSAYVLINTMKKVLERYIHANMDYKVSITTPRISVEDRKSQLTKKYRNFKDNFSLADTMDDCKDSYDVVVTFLAILIMINENFLNFTIKKDDVVFRRCDI